jgi:hypothetical protein
VKVRCGNTWDMQANELGVVRHRRDSWSDVVMKRETKIGRHEREQAWDTQNERDVDFGVVVRVTMASIRQSKNGPPG